MKALHKVNWLLLGSTNEYDQLKQDIAHICHDVTKGGCINEICMNDILYVFKKHGYKVVKRKIKKQVK